MSPITSSETTGQCGGCTKKVQADSFKTFPRTHATFQASGGSSVEIYITRFHDTRFVLQSGSFVQLDCIL